MSSPVFFYYLYKILLIISVKCNADVVLYGKITEKDGAEYISFTKLDMNIDVKDYKIRLEGLFNGDKMLGEWRMHCILVIQ